MSNKILALALFLTLEMTIAVMIGCILYAYCDITNLRKKYGKELECKLADEDDLQSKSAIKEIVLRIF